MEKVTISKARALFVFLLDNFNPDKKLGELQIPGCHKQPGISSGRVFKSIEQIFRCYLRPLRAAASDSTGKSYNSNVANPLFRLYSTCRPNAWTRSLTSPYSASRQLFHELPPRVLGLMASTSSTKTQTAASGDVVSPKMICRSAVFRSPQAHSAFSR